MHLLQSVVLTVEGVDDVILLRVNLIVDIDRFLDEIDKLLHLLPEELVDVICELSFQDLDPFFAGPLL